MEEFIEPAGRIKYSLDAEVEGHLVADGREVSRTLYSELYASVGTIFGAGDGSTTFNLPDFRNDKVVAHISF